MGNEYGYTEVELGDAEQVLDAFKRTIEGREYVAFVFGGLRRTKESWALAHGAIVALRNELVAAFAQGERNSALRVFVAIHEVASILAAENHAEVLIGGATTTEVARKHAPKKVGMHAILELIAIQAVKIAVVSALDRQLEESTKLLGEALRGVTKEQAAKAQAEIDAALGKQG